MSILIIICLLAYIFYIVRALDTRKTEQEHSKRMDDIELNLSNFFDEAVVHNVDELKVNHGGRFFTFQKGLILVEDALYCRASRELLATLTLREKWILTKAFQKKFNVLSGVKRQQTRKELVGW